MMEIQGNHETVKEAAWQYALKLLRYRQRSEMEMLHSLQKKGFSEEIITGTLNRLKANKLLDDNQFACNWVTYRLTIHPVGRIRLKYELQQHGIPSSLAEDVVTAVLSEEAELVAASGLAQRYRQRKGETASHYYQRLVRFLQQRGFSRTIICQVLKKAAKNNCIDNDVLN